jgi:hypothetical protein
LRSKHEGQRNMCWRTHTRATLRHRVHRIHTDSLRS